jgi:hypothetical protein
MSAKFVSRTLVPLQDPTGRAEFGVYTNDTGLVEAGIPGLRVTFRKDEEQGVSWTVSPTDAAAWVEFAIDEEGYLKLRLSAGDDEK